MAFCDFVVKYDPKKDTKEELTLSILYSIWIKRLKNKKPVRIFIAGKSGEGKSWGAISLQEALFKIQGLDFHKHFEAINVFTPLEYPTKLDKLLIDKELKKINIICMHEAREIIKAADWQKFLSTAIADVHALSRTVKRMIFLIISQSIRSITRETRYTIDFYCTVRRLLGKRPRLTISVMYIDERDIEKPKLKRRKLSGYLVYPTDKWRRFVPTYLELSRPDKKLTDKFEKLDYEAKKSIIQNKLKRLLNEIKMDIGDTTDKVKVAVDWYLENQEQIHNIGKLRKNKFKVLPGFRKMLELSKAEAVRFETLFYEGLKEKGQLGEEPINEEKKT